jgi:hypothetical protein
MGKSVYTMAVNTLWSANFREFVARTVPMRNVMKPTLWGFRVYW